jgi:hypothetical protein
MFTLFYLWAPVKTVTASLLGSNIVRCYWQHAPRVRAIGGKPVLLPRESHGIADTGVALPAFQALRERYDGYGLSILVQNQRLRTQRRDLDADTLRSAYLVPRSALCELPSAISISLLLNSL